MDPDPVLDPQYSWIGSGSCKTGPGPDPTRCHPYSWFTYLSKTLFLKCSSSFWHISSSSSLRFLHLPPLTHKNFFIHFIFVLHLHLNIWVCMSLSLLWSGFVHQVLHLPQMGLYNFTSLFIDLGLFIWIYLSSWLVMISFFVAWFYACLWSVMILRPLFCPMIF